MQQQNEKCANCDERRGNEMKNAATAMARTGHG